MKTSIWLGGLSLLASGLFLVSVPAKDAYTAHEWGTFTSFQGGDGVLVPWLPLQTSELPRFVHNMYGLWGDYLITSPVLGPKSMLITLQRMETPVIYFYTTNRMKVDVAVDFPQGLITEWYPQVTEFGPMRAISTNTHYMEGLGKSRAVWKNLELLPEAKLAAQALLQDTNGSHYFAARLTSSALVESSLQRGHGQTNEWEKFIFYRGAGNFSTPLSVVVNAVNRVTVKNAGPDSLGELFLVSIHGDGKSKTGAWAALDDLSPGESMPWEDLTAMRGSQSFDQFQSDIAAHMQSVLVAAGLFPDEAAAMVATWKDSWFTEEGDRVLYILPRAWTDKTLPLTINPKPEKLVRVMVGRAEIFSPGRQSDLRNNLVRAANGDTAAREAATREIKALGRFAPPALQLVNAGNSSTNAVNFSYQLLTQSQPSKFE